MATLSRGYTFDNGEQLTPAKLNQLLSNATLANISASDVAVAGNAPVYGNVAPGVSLGVLWYDTTVGSEGLKCSYLSPSTASVAGFLYLFPRREAYFWAHSSVSLGTPLFVGTSDLSVTGGTQLTPPLSGRRFHIFDGGYFPFVYVVAGDSSCSGPTPAMVIAMESRAASGPLRCAWAGIVPAYTFGSPVTAGDPLALDLRASLGFRSTTPTNSMIFGTVLHNTPNSAASIAAFLLWPAPAMQDIR